MSVLHGFELLREHTIPEIASRAKLYRHTRTDAELLALTNDDPNKTFCVAFRIVPTDDTGVAHILEDWMLTGGSRKYPVKGLLVELGKGSLAPLITGFMHYDKPIYPCASRHLK